MKNADKPANPFYPKQPQNGHDEFNGYTGLTKREAFAMAAMQGYLSNPEYSANSATDIATFSRVNADALLKELENTDQ